MTNDRPAVILLGIKCNLEFIRVVNVGKLYCTVLFVSILLTSVSNTNKEQVPTGAARADAQLQTLQQNKSRERDIPSLGNICDQRRILNRDRSCSSAAWSRTYRAQVQPSLAAAPAEAGNSHE